MKTATLPSSIRKMAKEISSAILSNLPFDKPSKPKRKRKYKRRKKTS